MKDLKCYFLINIGVDNNNFTPISWEDVKIRIKNNIEFYDGRS